MVNADDLLITHLLATGFIYTTLPRELNRAVFVMGAGDDPP
jgi:hypothetical protein